MEELNVIRVGLITDEEQHTNTVKLETVENLKPLQQKSMDGNLE